MIDSANELLKTILMFGEANFEVCDGEDDSVILKMKNGVTITASEKAWDSVCPKMVEVEDGVYSLFGNGEATDKKDPVIENFDFEFEWIERKTTTSYPNEVNHSRKIYNLFVTTHCEVSTRKGSGTELRTVVANSEAGQLLTESYDDFVKEDHDEISHRKKLGNNAHARFKKGGKFSARIEVTAESLEKNPTGPGVRNRKQFKATKKKTMTIPPPPS